MASQSKTRRTSAETPPAEAEHRVIMTSSAVVFTLSPKLQRQAQRCMTKNSKVTVSFKEISVTKLPVTLADGVQVD